MSINNMQWYLWSWYPQARRYFPKRMQIYNRSWSSGQSRYFFPRHFSNLSLGSASTTTSLFRALALFWSSSVTYYKLAKYLQDLATLAERTGSRRVSNSQVSLRQRQTARTVLCCNFVLREGSFWQLRLFRHNFIKLEIFLKS